MLKELIHTFDSFQSKRSARLSLAHQRLKDAKEMEMEMEMEMETWPYIQSTWTSQSNASSVGSAPQAEGPGSGGVAAPRNK